jgi:hypothetical protein
MTVNRNSLFSFLVILVNLSCDYEPEKEYFKEVPPLDLEMLDMNIDLGVATDTVYLMDGITFTYIPDTDNRKLYGLVVYIGDKEVTSVAAPEKSFKIPIDNIPDGVYPLTLEMYTSSGTNSIADVVGAEQVVFSRTWVAFIDRSEPQPVTFTSIQPSNGTLKIEWTKYRQYNFQFYKIEKYCMSEDNGYELCWSRELFDQQITGINDENYIGGAVRYEIFVVGGNRASSRTQHQYEYPYNPSFTAKLRYDVSQSIEISWRPVPAIFSRNFVAYTVVSSGSTNATYSKLGIKDTTLTFPSKLSMTPYPSQDLYVKLKFAASGSSSEPLTKFMESETVKYGKKIVGWFYRIVYSPDLNRYFVSKPNAPDGPYEIVRLNAAFEIEQRKAWPAAATLAISENGQHLYVTSGQSLVNVDPMTLENIASFNISATEISVTNGNLIAVSNSTDSKLIKMPEQNVLATSEWFRPISVSNSGMCYYSTGHIYQWDGSSYADRGFLAGLAGKVIFMSDTEVARVNVPTIDIRDVATLALKRTIQHNAISQDNVFYDSPGNSFGYYHQPNSTEEDFFVTAVLPSGETRTRQLRALDGTLTGFTFLNKNIIATHGYVFPQ